MSSSTIREAPPESTGSEIATAEAEPPKAEKSRPLLWKLVLCFLLFLLVLFTLVYVVKEMLRHLRAEEEPNTSSNSSGPRPATERYKPRMEGPPATEVQVARSGTLPKGLKNSVEKAHHS